MPSAAICWSFLSHLDRLWAERKIDYDGRAILLWRRLQRDYPDDPLAAAAAKYGGPLPDPTPQKKRVARE